MNYDGIPKTQPNTPLEVSLPDWLRDSAGQGILVTDADLQIRFWNRWMESNSHRSASEMIGQNLLEVYPELRERKLERYYRDALAGQARTLAQRFHHYLFPMSPGMLGLGFEQMQQSVQIMPLMRADSVVGTVTLIDDVTERVAAEQELRKQVRQLEDLSQALRRSEQWLETTLRSIGDAVIATDRQGCVAFINKAAEGLVGWPQEEARGKRLEDVFVIRNEHTRAPAENPVHKILYEGAAVGHTDHTILSSRDGREIPIENSGAPIRNDAGEAIGVVLTFRDVTERRLVEAERERLLALEQQARARAETASRLKDEFLATVSHELRNPLNAILGWTLLLRTGKMDDEARALAVETVERNARMQSRLIEDLLDVSRIITGKLRLDLRPADILDVVKQALDTVRPAAEAKGVTLDYALDSSVGQIMGDVDRLQQIVWNLVSNAIKFTPQGGRVEVRLERDGFHAQILVTDTGRGISPEFLPYVFDRFRQADSTTTKSHGGLGLGLAIVRYLVEGHGGTVSAESRGEGQGAQFKINLPLMGFHNPESLFRESVPAQVSMDDLLLEPSDALVGASVLVVENDPDTRNVCRVILENAGAEVKTTGSADEARSTLHDWLPGILISDIETAENDGYELMRQLREDHAHNGTRLATIALIDTVKSSDRLRALSAGYQIHVPKPVVPAELIMVITSLIR